MKADCYILSHESSYLLSSLLSTADYHTHDDVTEGEKGGYNKSMQTVIIRDLTQTDNGEYCWAYDDSGYDANEYTDDNDCSYCNDDYGYGTVTVKKAYTILIMIVGIPEHIT